MSTPSQRPSAFRPAWLAVLVLPAALGIGWATGQRPAPAHVEPRSAEIVREAAPPRAHAERAEAKPATDGAALAVSQTPEPTPEPPTVEVSAWTTLPEAEQQSQRNGKPILIDFNAAWCGPCRALRQEVFEDDALGRAVQSTVIPVSIVDRSREEGRNPTDVEDLQRRFGVDAFPTLVLYSPRTGQTIVQKGYGGAEQAISWITESARLLR